MVTPSNYDLRSLQHERRMLELYRAGAATDGGLLQPLANACWRAAAFEWRLNEDAGSIRRLLTEAASAMADGFVRRRAGFDRTSEQLLLALHLSIGARAFDVTKNLMQTAPSVFQNVRASRGSRVPLLILEGYLSIIRAVFEENKEYASAARGPLEEARTECKRDLSRLRFVNRLERSWTVHEQETTCALLRVVGEFTAKKISDGSRTGADTGPTGAEIASLMDRALLRLEQLVEIEVNHRPKLYFWLPGVALTVLAETAGVSLDWMRTHQEEKKKGYSRLPSKLLFQPAN
jgi:hypothetical protein